MSRVFIFRLVSGIPKILDVHFFEKSQANFGGNRVLLCFRLIFEDYFWRKFPFYTFPKRKTRREKQETAFPPFFEKFKTLLFKPKSKNEHKS